MKKYIFTLMMSVFSGSAFANVLVYEPSLSDRIECHDFVTPIIILLTYLAFAFAYFLLFLPLYWKERKKLFKISLIYPVVAFVLSFVWCYIGLMMLRRSIWDFAEVVCEHKLLLPGLAFLVSAVFVFWKRKQKYVFVKALFYILLPSFLVLGLSLNHNMLRECLAIAFTLAPFFAVDVFLIRRVFKRRKRLLFIQIPLTIFFLISFLLFILLVVREELMPKVIDWNQCLSEKEKVFWDEHGPEM